MSHNHDIQQTEPTMQFVSLRIVQVVQFLSERLFILNSYDNHIDSTNCTICVQQNSWPISNQY